MLCRPCLLLQLTLKLILIIIWYLDFSKSLGFFSFYEWDKPPKREKKNEKIDENWHHSSVQLNLNSDNTYQQTHLINDSMWKKINKILRICSVLPVIVIHCPTIYTLKPLWSIYTLQCYKCLYAEYLSVNSNLTDTLAYATLLVYRMYEWFKHLILI